MDLTKRNAMKIVSGAAIAAAAAGVFLIGTANTVMAADSAKVHCTGANACKGHSDCKSANNECKGQNACKGKGFVKLSEQECIKKGGTVEKS